MAEELTVFVVDDNVAVASSVEALLASIGLKVESYPSAEEFLAAFDPGRKGCLLLDIRLQGMDGLELLEVLSARKCELPIIVMSGHADEELIEKALQYGAIACLEKAFDGKKLCELVRSVMSRP